MERPGTREEAAVVAAFLVRCLADRAAGRAGTLAGYQALFPGHADAIAREFEALGGPASGTAAEGASGLPHRPEDNHIGPYRLTRPLGRGGQGEVWLAFDERLRRPVALKLLRSPGPVPAPVLERFRREAEIASRLDHPGICAVLDARSEGGLAWIAMRFVDGETLASRIEARRAARKADADRAAGSAFPATRIDSDPDLDDPAAAAAFFEQAARALHAAHAAGVVHRDLKPANIMIAPGGRPVILDFGLARDLVNEMATLTATGDTFGTPAYMAPEQVSGASRATDSRTDVWALGVTIYEALTLRRPFEGATREALFRAILEREPATPRSLGAAIPRDLEVVVLTALRKEPDRRYQTAEDLAEDLRRVRMLEPIRARPPGRIERTWRWARRKPAAAAALVLAVALAAAGTFLALRWKDLEAQEARRREDALEREIEEGYFALAGTVQAAAATAAFRRALAIDPASPEAYAGLALAFAEADAAGDARAHLDSAPAAIAGHPALRAVRDGLSGGDGAAAPSRTGPETAEGTDPDPTALLINSLRALRSAFDGDPASFGRASDLLQRCILLSPRARRVHHVLLGLAASNGDDAAEARRIADVLVRRWPDSPRAAWAAGTALILHDPAAAEPLFERALAGEPGHAVYLTCLGQVRRERGDPRAAIADHRAAIAAAPGFAPAWRNLGTALKDLGDLPGAAEAFAEAVRLAPQDVAAAVNLGTTLRLQGETARAIEVLRGVVARAPGCGPAWAALALAHVSARDSGAAAAALAETVRLSPALAHDAAINLGAHHLGAGDAAAAAEVFRALARRQPGSAPAWSNLAIALQRLGRCDEALAASGRAAELAPGDQEILVTLSVMRRENGDFDGAIAALRRAEEAGAGAAGASRPIRAWIAEAERLQDESRQIEHFVLRGELGPEGLAAVGSLARTAMLLRRHAAAARLAEIGIERAGSGSGRRDAELRVTAARASVLAAAGEGRDAAGLSAAERDTLRRRALERLAAAFAFLRGGEAVGSLDAARIREMLGTWLLDPAFASVRSPERRATLDAPESARWQSFWDEVEKLRASLSE